ncbi:MAG TPA: RDD family protein [Aggregatilineales bacterium]|nr:RDD family protein [Aggregatilineales bacterium]
MYESENTTTHELADIGTRFFAYIVDAILIGIVGGFFGANGEWFGAGLISFLIGVVYFWYFWTRHDGQTPGKMLTKIRVVKANGMPMTDADAIVRSVGYWVNGLVFGLGFLWAFFDDRRQGWHDKLASTYVVRASEKVKVDRYVDVPEKPKRVDF